MGKIRFSVRRKRTKNTPNGGKMMAQTILSMSLTVTAMASPVSQLQWKLAESGLQKDAAAEVALERERAAWP